jgi:hypothetical protein
LRVGTENSSNYAVVVVGDGSQILPDQMAQYTPHLSLRGSSQVFRLMPAEKAEALHEESDLTDTNQGVPDRVGPGGLGRRTTYECNERKRLCG